MSDYKAIKNAAIISIIFSMIHIIGAAIIIAAPIKVGEIFLDFEPSRIAMPLPLSVYLYPAAFMLNILADILIIKRVGTYSPIVISLLSVISIFTFANIITRIQTMTLVALIGGTYTIAFFSSLISANNMLFMISFVGYAVSVPLSAVYLYLRKKESSPEYRSPASEWAVAGIVLMSLHILFILLVIIGQDMLHKTANTPSDIIAKAGFRFPAAYAVMLLVCAFGIVCCASIISGKNVSAKFIFAAAVAYPLVMWIAEIAEGMISGVYVMAYNSTLYAYGNFFEVFGSIGILMCVAAAEVKAMEKRFIETSSDR